MAEETLDLRLSWRKEGEYTMPGSCSNCGWKGTLILSKGSEAPTGGPVYHSAKCKNRGCRRVRANKP